MDYPLSGKSRGRAHSESSCTFSGWSFYCEAGAAGVVELTEGLTPWKYHSGLQTTHEKTQSIRKQGMQASLSITCPFQCSVISREERHTFCLNNILTETENQSRQSLLTQQNSVKLIAEKKCGKSQSELRNLWLKFHSSQKEEEEDFTFYPRHFEHAAL